MVRASIRLGFGGFLLATGCAAPPRGEIESAPSSSATGRGSAPTPASTVEATAGGSDPGGLRGTFRGQTFQSKVGLARRDARDVTNKAYRVWIFGADATCENLGDPTANSAITVRGLPADTRFLSSGVAWETGAKLEVADYNTALSYLDADGNVLGGGALSGSIEVVEAAQAPGTKAKVRVEVKGKDSDLAGTVELTICP